MEGVGLRVKNEMVMGGAVSIIAIMIGASIDEVGVKSQKPWEPIYLKNVWTNPCLQGRAR